MFKLTIPLSEAPELWDEEKEEFVSAPCSSSDVSITLEHSLLSLSKWESRWNKPFLGAKDITREETVDYIRCMTITPNVNPDIYSFVTDSNILSVQEYIDRPMTAATINYESNYGHGKSSKGKIITSELIYYWMIALNIPFECQKWHLNRLLTLVQVCEIEGNPDKKKMSKKDVGAKYRQLNAERKAKMKTHG